MTSTVARRRLEWLPDLGRATLLCGAALGLASAWVWRAKPELLTAIHERAVRAHVEGPAARLAELRRECQRIAAGGDPGTLVADVRALSRTLQPAQLGDRRFGARLEAERLLARALLLAGEPLAAADVAEDAIALDPRNLPHVMACARILVGEPALRARAEVVLDAALTRFPGVPVIARTWIESLPLGVRDPAAPAILARHLAAAREPVDSMEGLDQPWRAWLDGLERTIVPFRAQRGFAVRVDCEALPAVLRLAPGPGIVLVLAGLRVTFDAGDGPRVVDATPMAREAGLEVDEGPEAVVDLTRAAGRTLELSVPEDMRGRPGSITLQGAFTQRPRWIRQVSG